MSALAPLPAYREWAKAFPRRHLAKTPERESPNFPGRHLLASTKLCDDFVRALQLRPDEVVLDLFSGPGQLTRSLLDPANSSAELPPLVVACDTTRAMLTAGLGLPKDPPPDANPTERELPNVLEPTAHPRLLGMHGSPYGWRVATDMLSDPRVAAYMARSGGRRPWDAEAPHVTVTAQLPDSVIGEQMVSQWIGSVVEGTSKSWIWEWGRVRFGWLVGKGLYDRLMAKPGETITCKLSVLANALFHIAPLPPYHHVFNVDKSSKATESRADNGPIKRRRGRQKASDDQPAAYIPPDPFPRTHTIGEDFYPLPASCATGSTPLPRPALLGLKLEPRTDCLVLPRQKDAWDFILRKAFTRQSQPIREAVGKLAFGGDALLGKIEGRVDEGRYRGVPVVGDKKVLELRTDEWARIVDVFDRWAFKPEYLFYDSIADDDFNRQIGHD